MSYIYQYIDFRIFILNNKLYKSILSKKRLKLIGGKYMERDRGTKVLAIFAICIAIIGMTVGFASFSTILKIEGTGDVKASKFSVIFQNLQTVVETGTANEVTAPTIKENGTKISEYSVELMTPGDTISYTFDITNDGTYDAEIGSITMAGTDATPFVVTGGDATDQANVKNKLTYSLVYVGGAKDGQALAVGDPLTADRTVTAKLTLAYQSFDDESLLPKATVTISNLAIDIDYVQQ